MEARPSGASMTIVPVAVSLVSATLVSPSSKTVFSPVAAPFRSSGVTSGLPSVLPVMPIVSVASSVNAPSLMR